jgi:hypothetical protein
VSPAAATTPTSSTRQKQSAHDFPKQSLTATVSFVEDRIRAMQVDLVVSQQPSAKLQYRMARCHILCLYLLGHVPTYEATFGLKALSAALTNYWEEDVKERRNRNRDDEMLCFMALHQLCQYLLNSTTTSSTSTTGSNDRSEQHQTEALSSILDYYRRNVDLQDQRLHNFPKLEWAMKVVDMAVMGRPRSILRQLVELGNATTTPFAFLCRGCMAPAVDTLRLLALDQYNTSFMKGEKVTSQEISRLLYFESAQQAQMFATQTVGLTLHEDGDKIVFKVGPIRELCAKDIGRRQDAFVFGPLYSWASLEHGHIPTAEATRTTARDDTVPSANMQSEGAITFSSQSSGARIDTEGVMIPPPDLMERILQLEDNE